MLSYYIDIKRTLQNIIFEYQKLGKFTNPAD